MGINIDGILRRETGYLVEDAKELSLGFFVEVALREDLRQEDWSRFWKAVSLINYKSN